MNAGDLAFWLALMEIIGVNIVLSGDNAVVIALAARSLPEAERRRAVLWGSAAAVVMRIVLTLVAVELLRLPWLKLTGAALLLWIGVQLLLPEKADEDHDATATSGMFAAIRTILIADLVMSLDNVIAVAAAAHDSVVLLSLGLLISIPIVVFGSTMLMKLMERWPIIITLGGALLGWVAGEMAVTDPAIHDFIARSAPWLHFAAPLAGALAVVAVGRTLAARAAVGELAQPIVDLAMPADQHAAAAAALPLRFLLAVDDSETSLRAVRRFIAGLPMYRSPVAVDLLNVQAPVPRDAGAFANHDALRQYHHDEGMRALQRARTLIEDAGIACAVHIGVGDLAHQVAHYARELSSAQVFLTETERCADGAIGAVVGTLVPHIEVPLAVVR